MFKKVVVLFVSTILSFHVQQSLAQKVQGSTLEGLQAIRKPVDYKTPKGGLLGSEDVNRVSSGEPVWFVYSDRENNKTYLDKNCTQESGMTLNFLQACVVAEDKGDALRIIEYDGADRQWEEKKGKAYLKKTANDKGWIKKKNILMWDNCLVDSATQYSTKAISVKKIPASGDINSLIKSGVLDLYNVPKKNSENLLDLDIRLFQYLFVFKEENGMYLLSKTINTYPGSVGSDIIGWASQEQLHIWDNAMCLRSNFEQSAIEERASKKIDVKFFSTFEAAKKFRDGGASENTLPFLYSDPTEDNVKDNPYFYGFPIVSTTKDPSIYKTGYVTDTKSKEGKTIFKARDQAGYNQEYEELSKQKTKINIVFVLDGNSREYMKTMSKALMDNTIIGTERTRNDFRFGAIIYNAACDEPIVKKQFNNNKSDFAEMLVKEGMKPVCPSFSADNGAPIYSALKQATAMFSDSKATNILIVTGSVSDKDKSLKNELIQSFAAKQVKMHYYQLINADKPLYDDYQRDAKMFLEKTAETIDSKFFKADIEKGKRKKAKLEPRGDDFVLANSGVPGAFYSKDQGETFSAADLTKRLKKLLFDIDQNLTVLLSRYEENTVGKRQSTQSDEEEIKQLMLLFKGGDAAPEIIEKLASENNFQLFIEAYAPLTSTKLNSQLMNRTLFLSSREFGRLEDAFNKLKTSTSAVNDRQGIVDTYKDLITTYKGGNVDAKTLVRFTTDDFMSLVTSLPPNNNPLLKKSLKELEDPKKTKDDYIEKLKKNFVKMSESLKQLKRDPRYRMEQDDETFYWVPEKTFHIDIE